MSSTSTEVPSLPVEQTKQSVDQDPSPDSGASPTLSINSLGIVQRTVFNFSIFQDIVWNVHVILSDPPLQNTCRIT